MAGNGSFWVRLKASLEMLETDNPWARLRAHLEKVGTESPRARLKAHLEMVRAKSPWVRLKAHLEKVRNESPWVRLKAYLEMVRIESPWARLKACLEKVGTESPWASLRARLKMLGTESPWARLRAHSDEGGTKSPWSSLRARLKMLGTESPWVRLRARSDEVRTESPQARLKACLEIVRTESPWVSLRACLKMLGTESPWTRLGARSDEVGTKSPWSRLKDRLENNQAIKNMFNLEKMKSDSGAGSESAAPSTTCASTTIDVVSSMTEKRPSIGEGKVKQESDFRAACGCLREHPLGPLLKRGKGRWRLRMPPNGGIPSKSCATWRIGWGREVFCLHHDAIEDRQGQRSSAQNDRACLERDVLSLTEVVALLEAELKAEGPRVVASYKASRGLESGLEKMGRVSYEFEYRVALERLRGKHPEIAIKQVLFAECPDDTNVEMDLNQPFDDKAPIDDIVPYFSSFDSMGGRFVRQESRIPLVVCALRELVESEENVSGSDKLRADALGVDVRHLAASPEGAWSDSGGTEAGCRQVGSTEVVLLVTVLSLLGEGGSLGL
ncbi:hypothetical protein BHE74_00015606 [Ensete ventricosum]|nr:hypothetical protein BHE74_00015606 [Ensete ventricosum]